MDQDSKLTKFLDIHEYMSEKEDKASLDQEEAAQVKVENGPGFKAHRVARLSEEEDGASLEQEEEEEVVQVKVEVPASSVAVTFGADTGAGEGELEVSAALGDGNEGRATSFLHPLLRQRLRSSVTVKRAASPPSPPALPEKEN
uniref:Uncharacterized protein n=1 Tax=Ananas comosus var. bracteatus TaxID=296719 RepID=A0A6V7Q3E1_ANACO|nr:unnamed protein product [Ananas comosus var. bracteatus]